MSSSGNTVSIERAAHPICDGTPVPTYPGNLRVLHVLPSLDPRSGGVAEAVVQFVKHMLPYGCVSEVATLDTSDGPRFDRLCGAVHRLGPGFGSYGMSRRLMVWMRENASRYDAIIVHGIWQFHSLAAAWAVFRKGTPLFVFPHGMLDPWFQHTYPAKHVKKRIYWMLFERWVFRRANAVLFTCQTELELARKPFLDRKLPLRVNGFGIESVPGDKACGQLFRDTFPELRDKRVLLFLSRIHEKKGCDLLIGAFAKVAPQHPDVRLVIAGPGDPSLVNRLKRQALDLQVDRNIVWTGMLSGELKWAALRAAELFVLPSHQENFGIAVVESLASGTPVLITNRVNIWQEIVESGGGWVCADTEEGVADALQRWCADTTADQRRLLGMMALECYQNDFQIEAAARRLTDTVAEATCSELPSCPETTV